MKYWKLIFIALFLPLILQALNCEECRKKIRGNYIRTDKGSYCSRKCMIKTLPKCKMCKKPVEQGMKFKNQYVCRQCMCCAFCKRSATEAAIFRSIYGEDMIICRPCTKKPQCYYCNIPANGKTLPDGRKLCRSCLSRAIISEAEVRRIFRKVRKNLAIWCGFDPNHPIELKIVDAKTLEKESSSTYSPPGGRCMALMRYQKKVTKQIFSDGTSQDFDTQERCQIYVLDCVPEDMLIDALAHELTHDHLRHNVGKVKELANEEGFCELVAAIYNRKIKNHKLNNRKMANPDPVYGGGYRKMHKIYFKKAGCDLKMTMRYVK